MERVKLGVIGAGGIAETHLRILAQRRDVQLAAIADVRADAAEDAAKRHGIPAVFSNHRTLLQQSLDGVLICVPTFLHGTIALEALDAGKHVFCEKPMERTLTAAEQMADASRRSGKSLQIGFVRRFDDEWLAFRRIIQEGKIGRPVAWHDMASGAGPSAPWYLRDEQGGGPFLDGCVHNLDFALYTFGPAEWVFAHLRTLNDEHTALDTGSATIRFRSGDELLLVWSWGLPSGVSGCRVFQLLGPSGVLSWQRGSGGSSEKVRCFNIEREVGREAVEFPARSLNAAYERQMEDFVRVCRAEKQPESGIEAGLESLRLAAALLESGRRHEKVTVRGFTGG